MRVLEMRLAAGMRSAFVSDASTSPRGPCAGRGQIGTILTTKGKRTMPIALLRAVFAPDNRIVSLFFGFVDFSWNPIACIVFLVPAPL
jgi:hypothetical protein